MDYLDVIGSDMSRFHRVDDLRAMTGRRLLELAPLLPAYRGALYARLERERERREAGVQPEPGAQAAPDAGLSAAALRMKYRDLIE